MTVAELPQPRIEPKRDRFGRYLIPVGGKHLPYTRATTLAGTIEDRYNLELWKLRTCARGIAERPDLYASIAATPDDDKKKLNQICEDALEAGKGSAGANLGTALHTFTERVDLGENITIPPPWDADIAAYRAAMANAGVQIVPGGIEKIVVLHDIQVAGTFDRLVTVPGFDLPMIDDLKTGAGLDFSWGSIAIQLALYAHADEIYDPVTDTTSPMPAVDQEQALVMHLPAGQATCTLYLVDIAAGWEAVQTCLDARSWRKRKDLNRLLTTATVEPSPVAHEPVAMDTAERREFLVGRIRLLRDDYPDALGDLATSWPIGVPTFTSDHAHTADELERIAAAIHAVESKHSVGFRTGDEIDPVERPAPADVVDSLVGRLKKLPSDLAAAVTDQVNGRVPHLRSGKFTTAHAGILEPHVVDAEKQAASRYGQAVEVLKALTDGDADLVDIVLAACGTDVYTWTPQQLDVLAAVHAAVDACHLGFGDKTLVPVGDGEKRLIDVHGTRADAVAVCKQIAEAAGLDKPRLLKDVVATPALFALAISAPSSISEPRSSAA